MEEGLVRSDLPKIQLKSTLETTITDGFALQTGPEYFFTFHTCD